ncbi:MAG: Aminomethyltransferase, mitochondrial [Piccolia ochrophora]|nr:MAG: Aminomethyltransferase, mitochondrial [Piccolia ochrophora]
MVPFGGYSMPVQYADQSITESHHWTREKASLFDVGHIHHSTLSTFLHPGTGGIVDDTVIARLGPELFYLVTNASNREKDSAYLSEQIADFTSSSTPGAAPIDWEVLDGWGLLALQGPLSASILASVLADPESADLQHLYFGQSRFMHLRLFSPSDTTHTPSTETTSPPILVSRTGYTGEDGFEISIPPSSTAAVATTLLSAAGPAKLRLAGLGARDSLRLEAGMCLYGHDLDDTTTPVEGALGWVVSKDRRTEGGFHGSDVILRQLSASAGGVQRRRVGLLVDGAPAREGAAILPPKADDSTSSSPSSSDEAIGTITSGCPSPSLKRNIAMGYVQTGFHKRGTKLEVQVRGKRRAAEVVKMPFVEAKFFRAPKPPGGGKE